MKVWFLILSLFSILINTRSDLAFSELRPFSHFTLTSWVEGRTVKCPAFRTQVSKRPALLNLHCKQDSKPKKDFFDIFASAVSGLVAVTGSTIDFRDPDEREKVLTTPVNSPPDISWATSPDTDVSQKAAVIDSDLDKLMDILSREHIDDPEDWMDLLERIICSLGSWVAEQPSDIGGGANVTLPTVHTSALRLIGRLQDQIKASDAKLYSSFKWVAKKHGLSLLIAKALTRSLPATVLQQNECHHLRLHLPQHRARTRRQLAQSTRPESIPSGPFSSLPAVGPHATPADPCC